VAIELDTSIQVGPKFVEQNTWSPIRAKLPRPSQLPVGGIYMGQSVIVPGGTSEDTSFASGRITWNAGGPVSNPGSGPPIGWSNPAGIRVIPVRTGIATASLIPSVTIVPPPPQVGPVVYALDGPVRARILLFSQQAGSIFSELAIGTGNIAGPVSGGRPGGGMGCSGAPVRNPVQGPPYETRFTQWIVTVPYRTGW
jgi:hypothetical protein